MPISNLFCAKTKAVAAKRERRKEARPGELLDAALDLFVEKALRPRAPKRWPRALA